MQQQIDTQAMQEFARQNRLFLWASGETDILPDGKFFSGTSSGNSGIGTDGYFTGYEFFQFIYRAYKSLYELEKAGQMR